MRNKLSLIGAAFELGQPRKGTELAPNWLKLKGLKELLNQKFFSVNDMGDLSHNFNLSPEDLNSEKYKNYKAISHYASRLQGLILNELLKEQMVITIGGDHSIATGTLAASLSIEPDIKVVWVDAHADINTAQTTPSGNMHGMPVSLLMKLIKNQECQKAFSWLPTLKPENIVYIGLRDIDPGEEVILKENKIRYYSSTDVHKIGIHRVLKETHDHLNLAPGTKTHLSFDVDGIDPQYIPSTGTAVGSGLTLEEGQEIIRFVACNSDLLSFDLVEVNPLIGDKLDLEKTAHSVNSLLEALPQWSETRVVPCNETTWPTSVYQI